MDYGSQNSDSSPARQPGTPGQGSTYIGPGGGPGAGAAAGTGVGTGPGAGAGQQGPQQGPQQGLSGGQNAPLHGVTQLHHGYSTPIQPSGCPFIRGDHHHQTHFPGHSGHAHPHPHPSQLPQHPQFSHHHQQQQIQQNHQNLNQNNQHAIHNQTSQSAGHHHGHPQQPPATQAPVNHSSFLSQTPSGRNPHAHSHSSSNPHNHPHSHYDPVHATSNNTWHSANYWPYARAPPHLPPYRLPSSEAYPPSGIPLPAPVPIITGPLPGAGSSLASGSDVGGYGAASGAQSQPFPYDHFTPENLYRQSILNPGLLRYSQFTPGSAVALNSQHQANPPNNAPASQSLVPPSSRTIPQQQPQQQPERLYGYGMSTLNPPASGSHFGPMSGSSGETSPDAPSNRRSTHGTMGDSSRGHGPNQGNGNNTGNNAAPANPSLSRTTTTVPSADPEPRNLQDTPPTGSTLPPRVSTPPPPSTGERRRPVPPRAQISRQAGSDFDSDEEMESFDEDDHLRFIEQFTVSGDFSRDMGEAQVRAHQILRGQLPNKRVASKKALSQLQTVEISSLEESERTCVICYNEFGVENPEGINEAPLRLPSCKHIFGDHCIKKWFEESDSCPYCRDKVPSEPLMPSGTQYIRDLYRQHPGVRGANGRGFPIGDLNIRIMPFRGPGDGDSRAESSPPRAWQTGGRRSPPSEGSESPGRRRRPRHSFRGTSSMATSRHQGLAAAMAPFQQSAARERFSSYRPYNYHPLPRAINISVPASRPIEPVGLNPPPPPPMAPQGVGFGLMMNAEGIPQPYQVPHTGGPGGPEQVPGPSQLEEFAQQHNVNGPLPLPVLSPEAIDEDVAAMIYARADGSRFQMRQ